MKFDYIIQNPPYSGLTHIDFLKNMYDLLPETGRMVIIQPSRFYIELRETKDRKEVFNPVIDHIKDNVYKTGIPRNIKVVEAASKGKSIIEFDIKASGAQSYLALAKEVLEHESKRENKR